jgi:hypothetical protein
MQLDADDPLPYDSDLHTVAIVIILEVFEH